MTDDWARLAEYVVTRRAELGITQIQVAQRGQMSLDRVQSIEAVRRQGGYRANTLAALERALQWEYGSIKAILAGGEPTPFHEVFDGDGATATDGVHVAVRPEVARASASAHDATVTARMNATLPALQGGLTAEVEVDFGIGDTLPYPDPRDEVEQEANETWQAAKLLEAVMRRQRKRRKHRDIDEAG
jgi:hypothetical protein